jgi:hypothetical protein
MFHDDERLTWCAIGETIDEQAGCVTARFLNTYVFECEPDVTGCPETGLYSYRFGRRLKETGTFPLPLPSFQTKVLATYLRGDLLYVLMEKQYDGIVTLYCVHWRRRVPVFQHKIVIPSDALEDMYAAREWEDNAHLQFSRDDSQIRFILRQYKVFTLCLRTGKLLQYCVLPTPYRRVVLLNWHECACIEGPRFTVFSVDTGEMLREYQTTKPGQSIGISSLSGMCVGNEFRDTVMGCEFREMY